MARLSLAAVGLLLLLALTSVHVQSTSDEPISSHPLLDVLRLDLGLGFLGSLLSRDSKDANYPILSDGESALHHL